MRKIRRILFALLLVLLLVAIVLAGEFHYASQISPKGIRDISDHVRRFGGSGAIFEVNSEPPSGEPFFEIYGFPHSKQPAFAFPASPPSYIYDHQGHFVTWCADPDGAPAHWKRWIRLTGQPLPPEAFFQRFVH